MVQQDGLQCLRDLTADQLEKVPYSPTTLTFATLAPNDVLYLPPACIFLEKSAVTDNVTLRCSTLIFSNDTLASFDVLSASYPKLLGCNWWYAKGNRLITYQLVNKRFSCHLDRTWLTRPLSTYHFCFFLPDHVLMRVAFQEPVQPHHVQDGPRATGCASQSSVGRG